MSEQDKHELEAKIKRAEDEAVKNASAIVEKIRACEDIFEHYNLINELHFCIGIIAETRPRGNQDAVAKAIEYLKFGLASMEEKIYSGVAGQRYDCLGTEEYDLFNEYYQKKEYLKDRIREQDI